MLAQWITVNAWIICVTKSRDVAPRFVTSATAGIGYMLTDLDSEARRFGALADAMRFFERHKIRKAFDLVEITPAPKREVPC